jgi:glycosyltransferase involved in cell wall biosynthesis
MKKRRIVLASILKPVDDTRMFEKLGRSLLHIPDVEIFIIGYPSKKPVSHPSITFIPGDSFDRISLKRFLTPFKILKNVIKVKPHILIVNTHELLIVALLNRILYGTKVIYDIQENYWRNILWTSAFPKIVRPLFAATVRAKEWLISPCIHSFFLAEKCYEKELSFIKKRHVILENKSQLPPNFSRQNVAGKIQLLFSGTLSKSTGVFQAIRLADELHLADQNFQLLIIGYCALDSERKQIKKAIQGKSYITLTGSESLVPHQLIIDQISAADFGIISYPHSPHIGEKIPTKLYEYLHARLPILLTNHSGWVELSKPCNAAIVVDFETLDASQILKKIRQNKFYTSPPLNVSWESEEAKLLHEVGKILI